MEMPEEKTHLSQWGNSEATRIPKRVIRQLGLKVNQILKVEIKNGSIVLTPEKKEPRTMKELFANWHGKYQMPDDLQAWRKEKPQGEEMW